MMRWMKKMRNRKGFTLAELLIVVAIIGVLVAISIPIFNAQLKKARFATNQANARAAYAAAVAEYLTDDTVVAGNYDIPTGKFTKADDPEDGTVTVDATAKGQPGAWDIDDLDDLASTVYDENIGITMSDGEVTQYDFK